MSEQTKIGGSPRAGISNAMITDLQYGQFMNKLMEDQRGANALLLGQWEQDFLHSYRYAERQTLWFTPARRQAADRMWMKYGGELKFPHPLDTVHTRPQIPEADPDGCQYLVREDGQQRRCNTPAELREPGRLRYCAMHGEAAVKAMERAGKTLRLIKYP